MKSTTKKTEKTTAPQSSRSFEAKWGRDVKKAGYCMMPSLLFRAQKRLGLSSTQLNILLQLADFWWDANKKPYPTKELIADRINIKARQVQRQIAELEKAGYVKRIPRRAEHGGFSSNEYDLSGLVLKLKKLAPEFIEADTAARDRRRAVEKRKAP